MEIDLYWVKYKNFSKLSPKDLLGGVASDRFHEGCSRKLKNEKTVSKRVVRDSV